MAQLLLYELIEQTPTAVSYRFGESATRMTSTVTLDPTDDDREPLAGADQPGADRVAGQVVLRRIREGSWPQRGSIQS